MFLYTLQESQAYLGDTAGSVPDHLNKVNMKANHKNFGFLMHIKDLFILYCSVVADDLMAVAYRNDRQHFLSTNLFIWGFSSHS